MQPRYALRFENGERRGETISITGSGITIGRKPGNSVQVLDASVSGRHAEFLVEPNGVLLRDLGSTNGTRVGSERISERSLSHGDVVLLGNVRMTLLDVELDAPAVEPELEGDIGAPSGRGVTSVAPSADDEVHTISADKVARSTKRSLVGGIALVIVLGASYAGWMLLRSGGEGGATRTLRAVEPVEGNLLERGYSFEGEGASWEPDEGAPAAFALEPASRRTGETGFGALLEESGWALARSAPVKSSHARVLTARGFMRVGGAARARAGLELESSTGASARTLVWSAPLPVGGDFEPFELVASVPSCFDQARVVLLAEAVGAGGGSVDVDDVSLVAGGEPRGVEAIDEFQFVQLGAPASAAVLFKIDRTLFSDLHVRTGDGALALHAPLAVRKGAGGFEVELGSGPGRVLSMRIDEALLKGGCASTGPGGYRAHATEFTREEAASLIAGSGKDQLRWVFDPPLTLRGRPEGSGLRIEAELGALSAARLQVDFSTERDEAQRLLRAAREAEKQGQLGGAAALWTKLRDDYPFDAKALDEADAARARIAKGGLGEVSALRREVERARFFRLLELYRECRRDTLAVAERYAGSEVESDARALAAEIDGELATLEVELARAERARLEAIARALEASDSPKLAGRVREYLKRFAGAAGETRGEH